MKLSSAGVLLAGTSITIAADCKVATVESGGTCFLIAQAAGITTDQLLSFNPGLDCNLLALGQKLCVSAGTLPGQPQQNPDGSCAAYTTVAGDSCSVIGVKFSVTVANIEKWNADTFHWKGCNALQAGFPMCVSAGTPPPPPIIPGLQCGPQSQGNLTCPLNACCSAFGFCGLTDEFCTTTGANPCISNCGLPTLPSCASARPVRKIGYYAGWGNRRTCGVNVGPAQIDWTGFTGVHFAFATISQELAIQLDQADIPLLQELVAQKKRFSVLQVIIAVGGWDFSEGDPTRDLFSIMIASSTSRSTFISSVGKFLDQFGLDGIDIDFEYPSAIERSAPATDTPNLTSFFRELRAVLPTQVISCATPAGYWFLKGFEIGNIAKSVTYLNMMSYDYHGPWDTNVTDQAPVTNPHTSILDMHDSALLYVRAGINLNIVNLGLAYYGRTFQTAVSNCAGYNCTMTGGGFSGTCTSTPGILAQFEIQGLLETGMAPTLDKSSQTYWFNDAGALITFDQKDTWVAKTQFAETSCFGGTFIWSLDQVTSDPGDGGGTVGGGPGGAGSGSYTAVIWNPNPFPSPGAASETFVQLPHVTVSATSSVVSKSTVTTTTTVVIPAFPTTTTIFTEVSGRIETITSTLTIPATTTTEVIAFTRGSTITSTATVTKTATTVIIPVPTTTTSITIEGVVITLNSGGTPVNSPVPTDISQPSAITPTFTQNISPSPNATIIVYTAPLTSLATWSSTITIPPQSTSPPVVVSGPPGDHLRCGGTGTAWSVLFGGVISGCPPAEVGMIDGITPVVYPPPGWTGPFVNPFDIPTGSSPDAGPESGSSSLTTSSSSTSTSSSACPIRTPRYELPDDPENTDWSNLGSDPDKRRRQYLFEALVNETDMHAERRAGGRQAKIPPCNIILTSPSEVNLGAGLYYYVQWDAAEFTGTALISSQVPGRPKNKIQAPETNQEHVFEIGYINQFFSSLANSSGPNNVQNNCGWFETPIVKITQAIHYVRQDQTTLGSALLAIVDNTENMVWVDKAMNQAKSNVVNNNRASPGNPPQAETLHSLVDLSYNEGELYDVETFLRNFAALGTYFQRTSPIFADIAGRIQTLLSEVTPRIVPDSSRALPVLFRDWLSSTVSSYPSGCTSRANNVWALYRSRVDEIARQTPNNGASSRCLPLYNANNYRPATFNSAALLPPVPALPACNVPGTTGSVGYVGGGTTVRSLPFSVLPERIMGAGNLNYYAVGSGSSLTDTHYMVFDVSSGFPGCTNVFSMLDASTSSGALGDANIDMQCGGRTGKQEANFNFVHNGQTLACAAVVKGDHGGTLTIIFCSVNQGAALACLGPGAFTVQMRWFPN